MLSPKLCIPRSSTGTCMTTCIVSSTTRSSETRSEQLPRNASNREKSASSREGRRNRFLLLRVLRSVPDQTRQERQRAIRSRLCSAAASVVETSGSVLQICLLRVILVRCRDQASTPTLIPDETHSLTARHHHDDGPMTTRKATHRLLLQVHDIGTLTGTTERRLLSTSRHHHLRSHPGLLRVMQRALTATRHLQVSTTHEKVSADHLAPGRTMYHSQRGRLQGQYHLSQSQP